MKRMIIAAILSVIFVSFAWLSSAQEELIIFPKEGQGREQKAEDKGYCVSWAKEETNVDPSYLRAKIEMTDEMIVRDAQGSQQKPMGRIFKGAARGAALGGIRQGIDSDVGAGAAGGAAIGIFRSRDAKRKEAKEQKQASQYYRKEQYETQYNKFLRAYSACMDAKGYSVK